MKRMLNAVALAGALVAASFPVRAADFWTAGDSHCAGIAEQAGWKTTALNGSSAKDLPQQLVRVPFGAFVVVCIGTNDVVSINTTNAAQFHAKTVLEVAKWRGQKLVWIGPSALKRSDLRVRADLIDGHFEVLMLEQGIPYISIFTDPAMQPADGIHLNPVQYRALGETVALQLHD
jgi:lysophospholipase L1-like esterase